MTQEFKNLAALGRHLMRVVDAYPRYLEKGANLIGAELVKSAQRKIGHLQQGAGPFENWEPLAESTLADKANQGYLFNSEGNPLYRTGELMDSILHVFNIASRTLYVGSVSEIMLFQEFGTIHIPPRSVLGLTMLKALVFIRLSLQIMMYEWITLKPLVIPKGLSHE